MAHHVEVEYEHPKGNDEETEETCTDLIEVSLYYEGPDASVGMLFGGWMLDWECPAQCQYCGHTYTEEEREEIGNAADKQAEDYDPEPDPGPDYDED